MLPTYVRDQDGRVWINPAKRHVRPYWLTTEPNVITVAPGGTSVPQVMPIDTQGHFEAFYMLTQSDGPYTIQIFDPATSRFWQNRELHIGTVAGGLIGGVGTFPFILPESYFFNVEDAPRSVLVTFRNLLPLASNNIRFAFHGRRIYSRESPPDVQEKFREMYERKERTTAYFLTTDVTPVVLPVALGATPFVAPIRNTDEADFEVFKLMAVSTGPFEFRLRDRASNRTIMNQFVHQTQGMGLGTVPFIFQESWLIERNYQVDLELINLTAPLVENTIFFTMAGRRLYYA